MSKATPLASYISAQRYAINLPYLLIDSLTGTACPLQLCPNVGELDMPAAKVLSSRPRDVASIRSGDPVLIRDGDLPRGTWPRGVAEATFPGRDGIARVVDIWTAVNVSYSRMMTIQATERIHTLNLNINSA
ncbi:unnamed protein product [Chilo suppressalis]|uniref:DUF5641 domain-containing protein n=1 Tax=Chilo suppressalis TaxID=168631 RepID=A0ABN8AZ41_CHISP|nr:unnamed protein product [Chilo suppressalis]